MVGTERSYATSLIIIAVIVCALGVLILPQVDLPDFVINGSKAPTIARIHIKSASSSFSMSHLGRLNPALLSSELYRFASLRVDSDAFCPLGAFISLRC